MGFGDRDNSNATISGPAFEFHRDFDVLRLEGTELDDTVTFRINSADLSYRGYRISVSGSTRILRR